MRVGKEFAFWQVTGARLVFKSGRCRVDQDADGTWSWTAIWKGDRLAGAGRTSQMGARQACKRALAALQVPDAPWPKTKRRVHTSYMSENRVTPAGHRWVRLDVRGDHLVRGELGHTVCDLELKVRGRVRRVQTIEKPGYPGACYTCNKYSWGDLVR